MFAHASNEESLHMHFMLLCIELQPVSLPRNPLPLPEPDKLQSSAGFSRACAWDAARTGVQKRKACCIWTAQTIPPRCGSDSMVDY